MKVVDAGCRMQVVELPGRIQVVTPDEKILLADKKVMNAVVTRQLPAGAEKLK